MKRLFTLLSSVLLTGATFAQIPNASFETWTTTSGHHDATSWGDLNSTTGSIPFSTPVYTCDSGMGGAPDGAAYIKLTTRFVPILTTNIPGVAVTGVINVNIASSPISYSVSGGFANTTRPQNLTASIQYMDSSASDHPRMGGVLWKWNSATSTRDTVALIDSTFNGMAMSWTPVTLPFKYNSGVFPDSGMIVLSSGANITSAVAGSYLYVDNLAFTGSVAGVISVNSAATSAIIYPNPASANAAVLYNSTSSSVITIALSDITGKTIRSFNIRTAQGENNIPIDLHGVAQGMYIVKIIDNNGGVLEKKLVVE